MTKPRNPTERSCGTPKLSPHGSAHTTLQVLDVRTWDVDADSEASKSFHKRLEEFMDNITAYVGAIPNYTDRQSEMSNHILTRNYTVAREAGGEALVRVSIRAVFARKVSAAACVIAGLLICASSRAGTIDLKSFEAAQASCQAALAQENFAQARSECEGLLRETPEHPGLQSRLAQSLVGLGYLSEAQAVFQDITNEGFGAVFVDLPAFAKLAGRPGFETLRAQAAAQVVAIAPASAAFVILERNFIAEGLAFDPGSGRFFAGSTYLRKIVAREPDGRLVDFVRSATMASCRYSA